MDLGIKGRRALVTASSGGMGRNIAHALAAEGADLVLFSRSTERLREVASEIQQAYGVDVVAAAGRHDKPRRCQGPHVEARRPRWARHRRPGQWPSAHPLAAYPRRDRLVAMAGGVRGSAGRRRARRQRCCATDGQCRLGPHHCGHLCPREAADGRSRPFDRFPSRSHCVHERLGKRGGRTRDHSELRSTRAHRHVPSDRGGGVHRGAIIASGHPDSAWSRWDSRGVVRGHQFPRLASSRLRTGTTVVVDGGMTGSLF